MPEGMPYPAVMDRLVEEGKAAGWKSIELRCGMLLFGDVVPSSTYLHHVLALTGDEERLFSALRSSTQRNIRKAEKEGVRTVISGSLGAVEEFYRLHCMTRRDHGLPPQPFRFFRNLHRRVLSKDRGFVALASCGGAGIAASLFLHFGDKAFYKYGASDRKFQHLRANNLLMWEGIRWFCRNGFKSLCFGRTDPDNEGLRRFKTGWGGEERTLRYYTYDIRKCGYVGGAPRVSGFHNRIFRNLPIGVSKVIGSALYKHMG
jgi:hypothetical protein